ncbi:MAG TPA: hypothetical protein VHP58_02395 [Alphaproteobacteria bacterium]|nr:hypothetical protein [Alphaproteobacteria bacterium]
MSKVFSGAVFRHEMRLLFLNPATLLFLAFAWVVEGFMAFYAAPLLHMRNALGPLAYVPMILCLLLPLLTMGMADDERSGKLERLLTLPIAPDAIWFTRFWVYWLVVALFLAGTWPLVTAAALVAPVDWLMLAKGYAVVWLVGGVQLAFAFWLAAETGQAVVAFLSGFLLNLTLVSAGWYYLRGLLAFFPAVSFPTGLMGDGLALFAMLAMPVWAGLFYVIYRRKRRIRAQG